MGFSLFRDVEAVNKLKFCGIEIGRTEGGGLFIHQSAYTQMMLQQHQLETTEPTKIILDKSECTGGNARADLQDEEELDDSEGKGLVKVAQRFAGELNWVSQKSRPDITYSANRA